MEIVKRVAPSSLLPVDLATVKMHCKLDPDGTSEDVIVGIYLNAAVRACENKLQRSIMTAAHELYAKCWKLRFNLQQYPVTAINSVKYYDVDGALQTIASGMYRVQSFRAPCVLEFDSEFDTPGLHDREFPIVVNFQAGYVAATGTDGVVDIIRDALLMETADRYENRQNEIAGNSIAMFSNNAESWLAQESLWL